MLLQGSVKEWTGTLCLPERKRELTACCERWLTVYEFFRTFYFLILKLKENICVLIRSMKRNQYGP